MLNLTLFVRQQWVADINFSSFYKAVLHKILGSSLSQGFIDSFACFLKHEVFFFFCRLNCIVKHEGPVLIGHFHCFVKHTALFRRSVAPRKSFLAWCSLFVGASPIEYCLFHYWHSRFRGSALRPVGGGGCDTPCAGRHPDRPQRFSTEWSGRWTEQPCTVKTCG